MYTEIGAFDAKAKLSELLRQIKHGQRYTITVRGHPVADLIPTDSARRQNLHEAINRMSMMRKVSGVAIQNITEWIKEGRR